MKFVYLLSIALILLLGACEIKEPVLPGWDIDLAVPLINEKFYVSDLVDSVNIITDNNEILTVTANGTAETPEFGAVPFTPNAHLENVPLPGTGQELFVPFVDNDLVTEISYAEISTGLFRTRFTDVNPSVQELKLVFHNIFRANGDEFVISYTGDTEWVNNSLAGLKIGTEDSGQIISELPITIQVIPALPQGTQAAKIGFIADTELGFSRFQGHLNDYVLTLDSSVGDIDIDYPLGIDEAITLQDASLQVNVTNYIGFASRFSGRIRATNALGQTAFIDIVDDAGNEYFTIPATDNLPGITNLVFHNNVSSLLQIMPTHLEMVDGYLTITSGQGIGEVEIEDKVMVDYAINAPMIFTLHDKEIVVKYEQEISISESNREKIDKYALGGKITLLVQNKLPIGAWANTYFSTTEDIDVTDPVTYDFFKHMELQSYQENPDWQTVELVLTKPQLDVFTEEHVYLRWSFSFDESGSPVTIYATTADFIHVKGMMIANILVEE